jgi:hypothetical protein
MVNRYALRATRSMTNDLDFMQTGSNPGRPIADQRLAAIVCPTTASSDDAPPISRRRPRRGQAISPPGDPYHMLTRVIRCRGPGKTGRALLTDDCTMQSPILVAAPRRGTSPATNSDVPERDSTQALLR